MIIINHLILISSLLLVGKGFFFVVIHTLIMDGVFGVDC